MFLLIASVSLALSVSFLCSLLEAVLLSVTPSMIAHLEEGHPELGARLRRLKSTVHRPLTAILSFNTVAHTAGAAMAGAQAQLLWGSGVLAVTSAVLTLLILVLSEILPKVIGTLYCQQLAPWSARILPLMIWGMKPVVVLSEAMTRGLSRGHEGYTISREEIAALARLGKEQGAMVEAESRILTNLMKAGSLRAKDIMTPRTVVISLDEDATVREAIEQRSVMRFSRIPIWREDEDDVVGYVLKDELLLLAAQNQLDRKVGELRRNLLVVPASLPIVALFDRFLDQREHIALVVDEYGGVAGVVSTEDVVETLLGMEIVDEADPVRDMRAMARLRWEERARRLGITSAEEKRAGHSSSAPPLVIAPLPQSGEERK